MKDINLRLSKKDQTFVMSLIGISDYSQKSYGYSLLESIIQSESPPDFIADLSILKIKNKDTIWYKTIHETSSLSSTVPCYYLNSRNSIDAGELLDIIIEQMEEGVKVITIHPTPNKELYELSKDRLVPCTSRGGNIVIQDLIRSDFSKENSYLMILPEIVKHAKKSATIISIGASYRSANIFDSLDPVQLKEIELQLKYADFIKRNGVEVIIETPGHASPMNIFKISKLFEDKGFPLMPLGPIPTDISIGMDHISAAIGTTLLGLGGNVKIIAAVTQEEHTGNVPSDSSVLTALRTAKLTAHILDMYKYKNFDKDFKVATERAKNRTCIYNSNMEGCSRCGNLCPLIIKWS